MRIAIANDAAMATDTLRRAVTASAEHQVIWTASDGALAIELCAQRRPDLLLMDLAMSGLDGIEATRAIMRHSPCAILIVTATPDQNSAQVFRAMGAGAIDVVATPAPAGGADGAAQLLAKIRTIGKLIQADVPAARRLVPPAPPVPLSTAGVTTLVAIGASTGGPTALVQVLRGLRLPPSAAVVIVQHIDERFTDSFAHWLGGQIGMRVTTIENGIRLTASGIYIAKSNDHLLLDRHHHLRYSAEPLDYPYRPSVDVFFHCIAGNWRHDAIGIVLTGMGRDGAQGLLAMRRAGSMTIAQDRSSAVYGMPRAAAEVGAALHVLPLEEIGPAVQAALDRADAAAAG